MLSGKIQVTVLLILIISSSEIICKAVDEPTQTNELTAAAVEGITRLYTQVEYASIENYRDRIQHRHYNQTVDKEYFKELDAILGNKEYYSALHFLFVVIHSEIINREDPNVLLLEIMPQEKILIHKFFVKLQILLEKYLNRNRQQNLQLMNNVTHWQTEEGDKLVVEFIKFPEFLKLHLPDLKMMI